MTRQRPDERPADVPREREFDETNGTSPNSASRGREPGPTDEAL